MSTGEHAGVCSSVSSNDDHTLHAEKAQSAKAADGGQSHGSHSTNVGHHVDLGPAGFGDSGCRHKVLIRNLQFTSGIDDFYFSLCSKQRGRYFILFSAYTANNSFISELDNFSSVSF